MIDAETLAFSHRLADAAGEIIRPYFRKPIDIVDKGAEKGTIFDPVTEADRRAEEAIRRMIEKEYPDDAILGEEFGHKAGTSGRRWVLDPVDGTRAFINGRYEWGCLIALEDAETPVLGIIDQPVLRERFTGANGRAEYREGNLTRQVHARACARIEDAVFCATSPYGYFTDAERAAVHRVRKVARLTRWGGDCYIFGILAMGFTDLIVESSLHRWDVAALIPIVEAAGGVITDWQGGSCVDGGQVVAAGDRRVHTAALALLRSA